jgi:hypothetical protein
MILTACSIYIGIEGHRTFSKHKHKNYSMLTSLLSHFGLEVDWPGYWSADDPPKLLFLFPRIPLVFERELRLTSSHYTEFAIWCAKHVSQGLR